MRSTAQLGKVLLAMIEDPTGDHYGFELSKRTGLESGSLYPILARLEANGMATSSWEDVDPAGEGRPRRRYYRLTASGCEAAESYRPERAASRSGRRRPSLGIA